MESDETNWIDDGSTWFLKPGFLVRNGDQTEWRHRQGGPTTDPAARCQICDRPWLKLWTIDLKDTAFEAVFQLREGSASTAMAAFRELDELPLYYCWHCAGEIGYRMVGKDRVEVLGYEGEPQGEGFPYEDYPDHFDELPLVLEQIPQTIVLQNLLERFEEDWMSDSEFREYDSWFRRRGIDSSSFPQLGGLIRSCQGRERLICPNEACDESSDREPMRLLANILDTDALPMLKSDAWVQVVCYICATCLSIRVVNRCD